MTFRVARAHCTIDPGSHIAFALACSFKQLAPLHSHPPQHPRVFGIEEPTPKEVDRLHRVLKLAYHAFPTPSTGITALRGPSKHLQIGSQNFTGSFDNLADINAMFISTNEALRRSLDAAGCHLRSYLIALGGFQTVADASMGMGVLLDTKQVTKPMETCGICFWWDTHYGVVHLAPHCLFTMDRGFSSSCPQVLH